MAISLNIQEEQLAEIFKGYEKIIAVYLFGSQVKGNADKYSDYDFAVLFEERPKDKWNTLGDLLCRAFSVVGQDKADVLDLIDQPLWFQQEIVKSGKIIYVVSDEKRLSYERELAIKCLEEGAPEYVEDGRMRKQDVQINFNTIDENMKMLEFLRKLDFSEFNSDFRNFQSTLHLLQVAIESLADISRSDNSKKLLNIDYVRTKELLANENAPYLSFQRRLETSFSKRFFWIPACAGMTFGKF